MWLQDLKKAIAKFEKDFDTSFCLIEKIKGSERGIIIETTAFNVYVYNPKTDELTLIKTCRGWVE
jgi:hypothetical protein